MSVGTHSHPLIPAADESHLAYVSGIPVMMGSEGSWRDKDLFSAVVIFIWLRASSEAEQESLCAAVQHSAHSVTMLQHREHGFTRLYRTRWRLGGMPTYHTDMPYLLSRAMSRKRVIS